ncbi:MAG TPA: hypothetical protein VGB79_04695 [Allosphingosinicella sp.]|jgi:hypothetical protein
MSADEGGVGGGQDTSEVAQDQLGREVGARINEGSDAVETTVDVVSALVSKNEDMLTVMANIAEENEEKAGYGKLAKALGVAGIVLDIAAELLDVVGVIADAAAIQQQGGTFTEALREASDEKVLQERRDDPVLDRMFTETLLEPPLPPVF